MVCSDEELKNGIRPIPRLGKVWNCVWGHTLMKSGEWVCRVTACGGGRVWFGVWFGVSVQ